MGLASRRWLAITLVCLVGALSAAAQEPRMSLEHSEPLFAVMASINACGYDQDINESLPIRNQIRADIVKAAASRESQLALQQMCQFYVEHRQPDPSRNLSQFVSLSLTLGSDLTPRVKESDMAPDASFVLGFLPLMRTFYQTAELGKIYRKYSPAYDQLIGSYHEQVSALLISTDLYLKRPLSGFVGRNFVVYLEPLASPGQINARNYADDYYLVISPGTNPIRSDEIRHTYLHFILDPIFLKRANQMDKLRPLLPLVQKSPLDETYKTDITLLTTECVIRAIEAHLLGGPKGSELRRQKAVDQAMQEGFILTRYFYDQLTLFAKDEVGLQQGIPDWMFNLDVGRETKRASQITFAKSASPDVVSRKQHTLSLIDLAERALSANNPEAAYTYAERAIQNHEDAGHSLFVLARASTLMGKVEEASKYFNDALQHSKDPRILAWSHIYLGRISDMQQEREAAIKHYRAALDSGDTGQDTKAAAERGLQQAYEPHRKTQ